MILSQTSSRAWTRATIAAGLALATTGALTAGPAWAAPPSDRANAGGDCAGRSIPTSKIAFQLYSAREWIADVGLEEVLATLSEIGYREVQPYAASYGVPVEEFEALLKKYGLKASSGQYAYTETTFSTVFLPYAKEIGHKYTGSGGFGQPGTGTLENTLATAEQLNRLGELSVKNGTGKIFGHNHAVEFTTQFVDPSTNELKSAWQLLVENTDPRWVTFEVDVFWAEAAGVDTAALLEEYGDRIELLHIKDADEPYDFRDQAPVGQGDIDWGPILEAAQGNVKYYVVERDLGPESVEEFAEESFDFLTCFNY
jgi:sugar phosphate isomerase/epimerase